MPTIFPNVAYLVTGSTDGLGRHTATKLASAGATVLVHGRNPQRVNDTVTSIKAVSKKPEAVRGYTHDFASLQEVRALAAEVKKDHTEGLVLVNNAGVFLDDSGIQKTADGFEMSWGINVLAPFLLTALLSDQLAHRVVNVASISAASRLDFDNLQQEKGFSAHNAYSLSKLCNIIFTERLAHVLHQQKKDVAAITLDPGTVNAKMLLAGWGRCGIEVKQANSEFQAITDEAVGTTKRATYLVSHSDTSPPRIAEDVGVQRRLWQLWCEQTGLADSEWCRLGTQS